VVEIEFAHLFPEWVLSWSLHQACKDASGFWNLRIVHSMGGHEARTFSSIFPSSIKASMLCFEKPFKKEETEIWGVSEKDYEKTFWGLRPDFAIKGDQSLILLESKSGDKPEKIYGFPRERTYYEFLRQCTKITNKGFYYLIPRAHAGFCKICLGEYFLEKPNIHSGFVCWEDLLPIIGDEIIGTVADRVLKEMEGLKKLRECQKNTIGID
jgi:hypothetical protein